MTAKQAIKARCRDCLAGTRECTFTDCALKGLKKAMRGSNRYQAIMKYCRWCLNGHPFKVCNSPDCAIYQYRQELQNRPKLPPNPITVFKFGTSKSKKVVGHA